MKKWKFILAGLELLGKGILHVLLVAAVLIFGIGFFALALFGGAWVIDAGHPYIGWSIYAVEIVIMGMICAAEDM